MCQLVSYKYSLYTNNSLHHVNNHSLDDTQRLPKSEKSLALKLDLDLSYLFCWAVFLHYLKLSQSNVFYSVARRFNFKERDTKRNMTRIKLKHFCPKKQPDFSTSSELTLASRGADWQCVCVCEFIQPLTELNTHQRQTGE